MNRKPRLLLVGRTRYDLPLDAGLERKFHALEEVVDLRVLGSAGARVDSEDPRFRLVPRFRPRLADGAAFHLLLPIRVAGELREFRPDAVLVQGAHECTGVLAARKLAGQRVPVILDVHGDWRTATRLYGSRARRLLNPLADRIADFGVKRADAVRTVSGFTTELVEEAGARPVAVFSAYMDLEPFIASDPVPLPDEPAALFVGVLERYKNVDGLAAAWRLAAPRLPGAQLRIVGEGPQASTVESLLRDLPEQTRWARRLSSAEVAAELDRATCLVLPSPREGMGRVVVEALCRGRPVVGARAGGIPDLIRDGENGLLVEPGDPRALADALVRLLCDRSLAERLAAAGRTSVDDHLATPEEYAASVLQLVRTVLD